MLNLISCLNFVLPDLSKTCPGRQVLTELLNDSSSFVSSEFEPFPFLKPQKEKSLLNGFSLSFSFRLRNVVSSVSKQNYVVIRMKS